MGERALRAATSLVLLEFVALSMLLELGPVLPLVLVLLAVLCWPRR